MSLQTKTVKGIGWSAISQVLAQGIQFVVKLVLARVLVPEHFGIIGMALIFTAFIQTVNELGLSISIIQRKDIEERHLSTSFWTNIFIGIIICFIAILASPFVADFFKEEGLQPVIRILSIGFILGSFGIVHRAILTKNIDFKNVAIAEAGAVLSSGIISIFLALLGFGVWSLVIGSLMGDFGRSVFLWMRCPWRPSKKFDRASFSELFVFGKNVLGSRIISYITFNADYFLIAKFLDATSLGLYTLAYQMAIFPLSQISSVITRVTFPIFSTIQDDNTRIRMGYLRAIKYTSLITFPLLTGLVVVAPELIPTLIGEKWIPMVSPLQILCIAGIIYSIATHTGSIILSKGRSDIHIRWDASKAVILPIAALIGVQYGIIGVATATALVACVLFLIIQKITNRLIDLRFYEFFKALYPATVSSTILVIGVLAFQQLCTILSLQDIFSLVGSILIGAVFYFLTVRIIDRNIFKEIKILLNQLT